MITNDCINQCKIGLCIFYNFISSLVYKFINKCHYQKTHQPHHQKDTNQYYNKAIHKMNKTT